MAFRLRHVQAPARRSLTGMLATTTRAGPVEKKHQEQDKEPNKPTCDELLAQGKRFARRGVRTGARDVDHRENEQIEPDWPHWLFCAVARHGNERERKAAERSDNGQPDIAREKAPIHWLLTWRSGALRGFIAQRPLHRRVSPRQLLALLNVAFEARKKSARLAN